ncbi:MAG: hypothetical protein VX589_03395 [Myxococcota bacterium]|nr:hypothetical protein [Myxococcota bacterium]
MDINRYALCLPFMLTLLAGCGLVLEDPRPYPEPSTDAVLGISATDAGMGERRFALHPQTTGPKLSVDLPSQIKDPNWGEAASTMDWLCDFTDDDGYGDICWVIHWAIP